jgi:hypothetical protein
MGVRCKVWDSLDIDKRNWFVLDILPFLKNRADKTPSQLRQLRQYGQWPSLHQLICWIHSNLELEGNELGILCVSEHCRHFVSQPRPSNQLKHDFLDSLQVVLLLVAALESTLDIIFNCVVPRV